MRNLILLSVLILAPLITRAAPAAFSNQKEIETYFDASPVRLAIYAEYVATTDFTQLALQTSWATIRAEPVTDANKQALVERLTTLRKSLVDIEAKWSEGIRHVLAMPTLSRAEADQILQYMLNRRATATQVKNEVEGLLASNEGARLKKN